MTVQELIRELSWQDYEAEVLISAEDEGYIERDDCSEIVAIWSTFFSGSRPKVILQMSEG